MGKVLVDDQQLNVGKVEFDTGPLRLDRLHSLFKGIFSFLEMNYAYAPRCSYPSRIF